MMVEFSWVRKVIVIGRQASILEDLVEWDSRQVDRFKIQSRRKILRIKKLVGNESRQVE